MSTFRGVTKAEAVARKVTGAISAFAITCVLIGAMSIVVDVLMRWIMNRSILALNEVLSIVFALAVIATIPAGAAYRVNLRLDLLNGITRPRVNGWLTVVASVTLLVFFVAIGWTAWTLGLRKMAQGAQTTLLYLPLSPVYFAVAISMLAAFIVQCINIFADVKAARAIPPEGTTHLSVKLILGALSLGSLGVAYLMVFDPNTLTNFVLLRPGTTVLIAFAFLWLGVFSQLPQSGRSPASRRSRQRLR